MQGLLFFLGFSNLLSNAFFRDPTISPHTNIGDPSRSIFVVTTAALPWMTGTAVNPLQRAAHLVTPARAVEHSTVTLLLPWLERLSDRRLIYGSEPEFNFDTANEQENYIREWLMFVCCLPYAAKNLKILWYTAWVNPLENSIYSMGDITALIDPSIAKSSICILEEPEHLNWYRPPTNTEWTTLFPHVVGIVHTNYFAYANEQPMAVVRAPGMRLLCSWMIRAHCHRVVMLSSTLGSFAEEKECVSNVHGVRNTFLQIGKKAPPPNNNNNNNNNVYFIGKTLKSKGIPHLMELLEYASATQNLTLPVDLYGDGPDRDELEVSERACSWRVLNVRLTLHYSTQFVRAATCEFQPPHQHDVLPPYGPLQLGKISPNIYQSVDNRSSLHDSQRGTGNGKVCGRPSSP